MVKTRKPKAKPEREFKLPPAVLKEYEGFREAYERARDRPKRRRVEFYDHYFEDENAPITVKPNRVTVTVTGDVVFEDDIYLALATAWSKDNDESGPQQIWWVVKSTIIEERVA